MNSLNLWYQNLFFKEESGFNMGAFRFLYCSLLFIIHAWAIIYARRLMLENGFYNQEISYHLVEFMGYRVFDILGVVLLISLFFSAVGFYTRAFLVTACLSYLLFEYPVSSVFRPYVNNITFFVLLIVAFSPGVKALSLDQFLEKRKGSKKEYKSMGWPFRAIKLTLGLIYLNAFVSKIINSGWTWAMDGHFQGYHLHRYTLRENPFAAWIVTSPDWVGNSIALFAAIIEAGFIVCFLLPKKYDWVFLVVGLGLHITILLSMQINFLHVFCYPYLCFINWESLYLKSKELYTRDKITGVSYG